MIRYGYLYGIHGKRKFRAVWFALKRQRDLYARADKASGFRVRLFQTLPTYYGA